MQALISLALSIMVAAAQDSAPQTIEGRWKSPGGNSIIEIAPCGDSLCGTVAWASAQAKADASKTTAQLVGTQILSALAQDKKGNWVGKLFIPDRNMHATAKIARVSAEQLKVSGCMAGKALCKSALWTSVTELPPQE
jgi:uncharacterized protein (DUF2147 family)